MGEREGWEEGMESMGGGRERQAVLHPYLQIPTYSLHHFCSLTLKLHICERKTFHKKIKYMHTDDPASVTQMSTRRGKHDTWFHFLPLSSALSAEHMHRQLSSSNSFKDFCLFLFWSCGLVVRRLILTHRMIPLIRTEPFTSLIPSSGVKTWKEVFLCKNAPQPKTNVSHFPLSNLESGSGYRLWLTHTQTHTRSLSLSLFHTYLFLAVFLLTYHKPIAHLL